MGMVDSTKWDELGVGSTGSEDGITGESGISSSFPS